MILQAMLSAWLCANPNHATKCMVVLTEDHPTMASCEASATLHRRHGGWSDDKRLLVRCMCPITFPSYPLPKCNMDEEIPEYYRRATERWLEKGNEQ